MTGMPTRFATENDRHPDIPWLRADQPESDVRVVVEIVGGMLVGAAMRRPNPLHPHVDFLEVSVPGPATQEP